MSGYSKVIKSKLSFKGTSSKSGIKRKTIGEESSQSTTTSSSNTNKRVATNVPVSSNNESNHIKIESGIGRITSSGTTIHGHETKFMEQLSVGDAILIKHPTSLRDETKIIRMVLSNISIGISSPFTSDIISTTNFQFIKAPKDLTVSTEELEAQTTKRKHEDEVAAFGTYASKGGQEVVYRIRKPGAFGGYAIVKETATETKSREDLLDFRAKKKGDRFCT